MSMLTVRVLELFIGRVGPFRNTRAGKGQTPRASKGRVVRSAAALRIAPARRFRGRFTLPGDKSISHRLAILGAMAEGETRIRNYSTAADCASTLRCLTALGVELRGPDPDLVIAGRGPAGLAGPRTVLDAGNSGSTLRMLAGVLAGRPFRSVLDGDDSLRRRPMERVAAPLRAMGASVATTGGRPPLTIDGGPLRGVRWDLPMASAQVKTAILFAGLQAEGTTVVREPAPSRDHTERLLPVFGVEVSGQGGEVSVAGGQSLRAAAVTVPGDVSSAAFLVVAALIRPGSEVRIEGVLLNPRRTAFLEVLREMGADIETGVVEEDPEPVGWIRARSSALRGTTIAAAAVPALIDEIPVLAVAAAHAQGTFRVAGAAELRAKESDRIAALCEGLARLGADVEERPDGFILEGGPRLKGAAVRAHGDHRIAMALAVAALAAEGETEIEGALCAAVSFPGFYDVLRRGVEGG
jgi:3-phosphoshikimate 1-carboxyvinyltransferase